MYRYTLHRRWARGAGVRRVCFCLLNPSTADARVLDPTLTRCLGFARRWGFGAMEVVNVFALRSTDPAGLRKVADPVGAGNDRAIVRAATRAELVVVGWGNHGSLGGRSDAVRALLGAAGVDVRSWGLTGAGEPRHPLYLRADTPLAVWG
jgi:hypothetical protein